jgi:hypothetical protein
MFSTSISPVKQRIKNSLISVLLLMFSLALLPFVLLGVMGLSLVTLMAIKFKAPKIEPRKSTLINAVKNKDYTVI